MLIAGKRASLNF